MNRTKKNKIVGIVILCLFLFGFTSPIVEELFDITGLKTSTSANFYAISESDETTRWIIQETDLTAVEDFHDDINTNYWNLGDVLLNSFKKWISDSSDYLLDNYSVSTDEIQYTGTYFSTDELGGTGITWDGTHFWVLMETKFVYKYTSAGVYADTNFDASGIISPAGIAWNGTHFYITCGINKEVYIYTSAGVYTGNHFDTGDECFPRGIDWDGTDFWIVGTDRFVYKYTSAGVYADTNFDAGNEGASPMGIVWDGTHFHITEFGNKEVYRYTSAGVYTGNHFDTGTETAFCRGIEWDGTYLHVVGTEWGVFKYEPKYDISKNCFDSGYMYMQTNITELISLKSVDYGAHKTLSSGDYFEVDFQTSSDSQINLIILKDGVVQKTLTLSQSGNSNFNRHTVQISVDETVEFDQLEISSTFEDTDYIKVWDIKTYKYTIVGDYADLYVSPNNQRVVNLTSETYNLRIFDPYDGSAKVDTNITIGTTDYNYVYTPTEIVECRLTLTDTEGGYLEFTDYHIKINRSLNTEWDEFWLLENIFSADIGTYIYISVYDRFDTLIDTFERLASDYIDLELEVYQFQIKNLMTEKTVLNINSSLFVHPLLSGDSIYFTLSTAYYTIQYYDTNNIEKSFTIYLDSNQAYELNRSQICFLSYTDEQGNHLFFEDYKTYLNGSLIYEKVFYEEIGTDVHINITDRYDINLYIGTYTVLASDNYIPIILEMYELKLKNMQNEFNNIIIERSPFPIVGTVGDIVESGHFPATYSFTDVPVGTSGDDIDFIHSASIGIATIEALHNGHKKVMKLSPSGAWDQIRHYISPQASGIIEFWVEPLGIIDDFYMIFGDGGQTNAVYLIFADDGNIKYYDVTPHTIVGYSANIWYHFKIIFDGSNDFYIWINGVGYGSYAVRGAPTVFDRFYLMLEAVPTIIYYFDAWGESWSTTYNLGDNLHDSYYLGYEPFENYNQTTEGDYTGTESFDYYTEEGVYYGTYDFRDNTNRVYDDTEDIQCRDDIDWIDGVLIETDCNVSIIADDDGHKKIIKFDSSPPTSRTYITTYYNDLVSGTIEFWSKESGINKVAGLHGADRTWYFDLSTYSVADTWNHWKLDFECGAGAYEGLIADTYNLYMNDIIQINGGAFDNAVDHIDTVICGSLYSDLATIYYYDAVGYSWDTTSHDGLGYTVGWNVNPNDLEPLLENNLSPRTFLDYGEEVSVINSFDGHSNVLRLDGITGSSVYIINEVPNTYLDGTIEFWYRLTNTGGEFQIRGNLIIYLMMSAGYFKYYNSTSDIISTGVVFSPNIWYHHKINFDIDGDFDWYIDGNLAVNDADMYDHTGTYVKDIYFQVSENYYTYVDGVGVSWDTGYDVGDNINSHGQGVIDELEAGGYSFNRYVLNSIGISGEFNNHKKFINMTDGSSIKGDSVISDTFSEESGTIEFYFKHTTITKISYFILRTPVWPDVIGTIRIDGNGFIKWAGDVQTPLQSYSVNIWYHVRIDFECGSGGYMGLAPDTVDIYINGVLKGDNLNFDTPTTTFYQFYLSTHTTGFGYSVYFDAIACSWISGYYIGDNRNFYDVESEYSWTTNIAPDEVVSFRLLKGFYNIWMTNSEETISFSFRMFDDTYFVLNRSQMCFLSYTNQRGEYLEFNQFKTYWNDTLLYENVFYEWIGKNASIEIKDHYDISVKNHTFIVNSGDNYVPIVLTMYSLKVMNQQEVFNHINITRDPNYYESGYYWSEWVAPTEIVEFELFAGYYKINLTDNENSGSSYYSYTLNGDDVLLISSGNTISNLIINIANVNTTIGNQITNVQIDLTNQNSNINNTIINIEINLSNVNSTLGNLLTNINLDIININNNISNLYTFTENNFLNLGNNINNSFISITNNIIAINQTISTLVIGLDGKITIVNATITTMFTEMNSQFIVVQSTLDFSFAFLNQTIVQIGNNITNNQIALNNLIIQRANDIDNSIIQIQTLINLLNSTVANESLVVQTLVNIIGSNITENHVIINNLINLLGNNITENNINLVSLIELVGNNITTNHFVIQTLIDYVSNNITDNHLEFLTNINLINNTIGQNQIELINRLLFINNSINEMALDLTNQIILVNNTIYSAILDVSVSIDFNSDNILGNISLTYQQNDFLTNLYRTTMFSQLLNWSGVAYNYSLIEDRIDVWEFINNYRNDSITVFLRYNDLIDNLTISAQNTIDQYLPKEDVEYRLWSVANGAYLSEWEALPDNRTVNFGFYETDVPIVPRPLEADFYTLIAFISIVCVFGWVIVIAWAYMKKDRDIVPEDTRLRHKRKRKASIDKRKGFYDHT